MIKLECGPSGNFHPGDVRDVSQLQGEALISSGCAFEIKQHQHESAAIEHTVKPTLEKHKLKRK